MSIEDPGWGDYVPLPGEEGKQPAEQTGGSPPGSGSPPSQPPNKPWWQSRSGIAIGAGVAAVILIVAIVALYGGGGGDPPPGPNPPVPTTPGPAPPADPTEQFLAAANQICTNYRSSFLNALQAYNATGDPSGLIPVLEAIRLELQGLGPAPAATGQYTTGAITYIDDLRLWIQALQEFNIANAQVMQSATATHSLEAGLRNCPPN